MPLAHLVCLFLSMSSGLRAQEDADRFALSVVDLRSAFAELDFTLTEQPNVNVNLVNRFADRGLRQFLAGNRVGAVREVRLLALQMRYGLPMAPEADALATALLVR